MDHDRYQEPSQTSYGDRYRSLQYYFPLAAMRVDLDSDADLSNG
jgi:hypothetical protein